MSGYRDNCPVPITKERVFNAKRTLRLCHVFKVKTLYVPKKYREKLTTCRQEQMSESCLRRVELEQNIRDKDSEAAGMQAR